MLYDLANDGGYVAFKWAAEDREGWKYRERMSKTCRTAEYYRYDNYNYAALADLDDCLSAVLVRRDRRQCCSCCCCCCCCCC